MTTKSHPPLGEHHDGAFDFRPPGGAGPVRPPPVAEEMPVDVGSVPHRHGDAEAHEEEVDEDDPDAGIEVDVYEGSSIKRKVGVLKRDANSIAHLLTHTGTETLSANHASRQR